LRKEKQEKKANDKRKFYVTREKQIVVIGREVL